MRHQELAHLRDLIGDAFSGSDLQNLVFDLGINWDELAGETHSNKIASLITYVEHRGRLTELIDALEERRSHIAWPRIEEKRRDSPRRDMLRQPKSLILAAVGLLLLVFLALFLLPPSRNVIIAFIAPSPTPTITPTTTPAPAPTATPLPTPTRALIAYLVNTDAGPQLSIEPVGTGQLTLTVEEVMRWQVPNRITLELRPENLTAEIPTVLVNIRLSADNDLPAAPDASEDSTSTSLAPSFALEDYISLYPLMTAQLTGSPFEIQPDEPLQKPVLVDRPTTWSWIVTPVQTGHHTLFLGISIPVRIDESSDPISYTLKDIAVSVQVLPPEEAPPDNAPPGCFPVALSGQSQICYGAIILLALLAFLGIRKYLYHSRRRQQDEEEER